jgi:hypothetical protein
MTSEAFSDFAQTDIVRSRADRKALNRSFLIEWIGRGFWKMMRYRRLKCA